jgi:hypothetical protein
MADFQSLLQEQKQQQDKEQVAISEAAQTYSLQIQKELGLGQSYIKKEGISNAAVSVVQNFQQDLDLIADADFTGFKDIVEKYKALLGEVEGSRRFDNKEKKYIADIVAPVLGEIYPLANAFTAARFGLRDFVKQFKPIKLAARVFGGVPILGSAIQKKIERQEAGEQELRRAERRRAQDIAKESRREIEEQIDGTAPVSPAEAIMGEPLDEPTPIVSKRQELAPRAEKAQSKAAAEEAQEEQRAEQEDRFNEQMSLWEMIAEDTYESKELLQKLVDAEEGLMDDVAEGLGGAAAIGGGAAAGVGGTKLASKFFGKKGADQASKTATKKAGTKVLGKTLLKSAIKKIPIIGAIAGIGFGIGRLMSGDVSGAALEVASGAASTIPGAGTAASVGIDAALAAKDIKNAENEINQVTESTNAAEVVQPGNIKDMVNIDSKRTIVRTTLETSNLENMLEKMMPKELPSNNVINTNQQINSASTNNVLPDLSNKNIDETVNALKNVY